MQPAREDDRQAAHRGPGEHVHEVMAPFQRGRGHHGEVEHQDGPAQQRHAPARPGEQHAELIKLDLATMVKKYQTHPIAWVTDDGPDGKGARSILRLLLPWLVTLVCWGHQSNLLAGDYLAIPGYSPVISAAVDIVRWFNNHSTALDLFNQEQLWTYRDRTRPRALLLPAATRWTSHFQSVARLLQLSTAMQACILRNKDRLLEIAAASQTDNARATALSVIASIEDGMFWRKLERFVFQFILKLFSERLIHSIL